MRTYIDWLTEAKGVNASLTRLGNELRERWKDWKREAPYATWEECCQAELGISASTLRRLNYEERNPEARNHKRSPGNGTEAGTGTDRTEDSTEDNKPQKQDQRKKPISSIDPIVAANNRLFDLFGQRMSSDFLVRLEQITQSISLGDMDSNCMGRLFQLRIIVQQELDTLNQIILLHQESKRMFEEL